MSVAAELGEVVGRGITEGLSFEMNVKSRRSLFY